MQKIILLIGCFLLGILTIKAQAVANWCGVTHADQVNNIEKYMTNIRTAKTRTSKSRNAITYVPIQYHIITRNNGTGGANFKDVLEQHCTLNNNFLPVNIQFYLSELPNVIANDVIFNNSNLTSAQFTMRQRRNREAINIWIVGDASTGNSIEGTTLGFYTSVNDWVVIKSDQMIDGNQTLSHEVGHFFSLLHTHFGWCNEPYDEATHGNPAPVSSPGAVQGPNQVVPLTELVDGSNCEVAGDRLCDTPPDYNFSFSSNGSCNYTRQTMDPNGDLVNPDETLLMSQYQDQCISKFSGMQGEIMQADIELPSRFFLRANAFSPLATEITTVPQLLSPIESAVTSSFNKVELKWQAVAGADTYLVEVDRSSGFNIDNFKFIVSNQTSLLLEDVLNADRNYRWRITPYNASYTCTAPSETARFRTGISTSVATITTVDNWTIQPNPMTTNSELTIDVNATTAFDADIKIFNLTGQLLQAQPATKFSVGNSKVQLAVDNLTKGVYFITLENAEGILNKKLVIQ